MTYRGGVILTLDLAGRTGFAVGCPDSGPAFGFHDLPVTGDAIGRYGAAFKGWFYELIETWKPEIVVYEQPSVFKKTTPATIIKLNGLATLTELFCFEEKIMVRDMNPSRLKKFWTGNGRADKKDMVYEARARGFRVTDHNAADAIAIWVYAALTLAPDRAKRFALGPLGAGANG